MQNTGDDDALGLLDAKRLSQVCIQLNGLDPNPAARDLAIAHQAFEYLPRCVDGNGESNPHIAARARINRGVDAQQTAVHIDQCATRVSWVDSCVGLDKVLEGVDAKLVAP